MMEISSAKSSNSDVIVTNAKKQEKTNAERQKEYRQRKKEKEIMRSLANASTKANRQQSAEKKSHAQRQKEYEQRQKNLPSKSQESLFDNLQSEKNSRKCKKYRAKSSGKTFEDDDDFST